MSYFGPPYFGPGYFPRGYLGPPLDESRKNAPLLMQTVIVPGDATSEGVLVQSVTVSFMEILREFYLRKIDLYDAHWRKLEEIIAASYKKAGFDEVILTPASNDKGRDVIAIKKGFGSVRIIEQVKRFSPGHLVTANDVRATIGVLMSDLNATKAVVTTTSDFAPKIAEDQFIKPHVPYRLELIDGNRLRERLTSLLPDGQES